MDAQPTETNSAETVSTNRSGTKICPLCTEAINKQAVICPKCGSVIGSWKSQIHLFIKFRILIIILGSLATLVAGFYINKWIALAAVIGPPEQLATPTPAPEPITATQTAETPVAPAAPVIKDQLDYAYRIEQGKKTRTGFLGLGKKTYIYYVRLVVANHSRLKLNKVRINLGFSNDIASHRLPFQYDILDETGVKITDLSRHFAGQKKAVMIIPFCLPEQNISLWLAFKDEVKVNHIDVYSEELKGTPMEFPK
ncbi:MAG: hypothetical protein HZA49_01470 [Planctomycetes bacterium]|nr:hypothetical protein [Planctomycetota bacterium]